MYSLKSMRASPQIIAQRNPKAQKAGGLCLDTPLPSETEKNRSFLLRQATTGRAEAPPRNRSLTY